MAFRFRRSRGAGRRGPERDEGSTAGGGGEQRQPRPARRSRRAAHLEAALLAAIAEADRGEFVEGSEVLAKLGRG